MIERTTKGGKLELRDDPEEGRHRGPCSLCEGEKTPYAVGTTEKVPAIGIYVETRLPDQRPEQHDALPATECFDTAVCADCLNEALAIAFGRLHVQRGGALEDLARFPTDPAAPAP